MKIKKLLFKPAFIEGEFGQVKDRRIIITCLHESLQQLEVSLIHLEGNEMRQKSVNDTSHLKIKCIYTHN